MSVATLQNELLNLSASERAKLIDVLWDSLSEPGAKAREAAWAEESERRVDAYDRGSLKSRSAGEVFAELEKKLRK